MKRILATSGGFLATPVQGVMKPGPTFLRALELSGKERPRVLFIMTASGDDSNYLLRSYHSLSSYSCDVEHLSLFTQPTGPVDEVVGRADVVWVGGGSVANLLAVWRLHGVDTALAAAWERGAILGGVSAGSICWHVGGPTDSFGPELGYVDNALGLLPYGNGVHYDSEAQRRPLLQKLVAEGTLPTSYATDDRVGILYEGTEPIEVLCDLDSKPGDGPAAYRIEAQGGQAVETRLEVGRL